MEFSTMSSLKYVFYILFHPIDGFQELKWNKKGSVMIANIIILLWYSATVTERQMKGFIFNMENPENINLIMIFISTILVFAVAVLANWSFSSLMDGEGKIIDLWIAGSYTLIPTIAVIFIKTVLSRALVLEEKVFLDYIEIIGKFWTVILIFFAIMVTHDFTPGRTITLFFLTILGMFAVLFLIILLYGLYNQVASFAVNLYYELLIRITSQGGV